MCYHCLDIMLEGVKTNILTMIGSPTRDFYECGATNTPLINSNTLAK